MTELKPTAETTLELIKNRRTIYPQTYSGEEVTEAHINTILEAARWAPSHRMTQPWRFVVFQGMDKRKAVMESLIQAFEVQKEKPMPEFKQLKLRKRAQTSGAILAIVMNRDISESVPEWEEIAATAMAIQNMHLQTSAMELGGFWSSPSTATGGHFHNFLELGKNERCLGLFYIGVPIPLNLPTPERKLVSEFVQWR